MKTTVLLIAITILAYLLQLAVPGFTDAFALTPGLAFHGMPWQFFTYMFLHAETDPTHIAFNMFGLIMFGALVEQQLGRNRFLLLYTLSGLGSAALHIFLTSSLAGPSDVPLIGASGAVFGVLAAYGFMFPRSWIFVPPGIPLPAVLAVFVFAGIELLLGFTGWQPGVANFGHLGGIVTGLVLILYWKHLAGYRGRPVERYEFVWE